MKKYFIYTLICPATKKVRWVGVTINPKQRFYDHTCKRKVGDNEQKEKWIEGLRAKGLLPIMEIIEFNLPESEVAEKEKYYISCYKDLLNIQAGGFMPPSQKGRIPSLESRRKAFENNPRKKMVIQKTKAGQFVKEHAGVRQACRATGIDHRSIQQVAAGSEVRKSAGGFKWEYKK